jgi:hypothetical protein
MSTRIRNLAWGVAALTAVPLATAAHSPMPGTNSTIQGKSANQVVAAARSAMAHVKSFHIEGTVSPLTLNLSVSPKGGGGSITESGATLEVVVAHKTIYIKANEQSWLKLTHEADVAKAVANKWIKAPSSNSDFADFADLTISKDFVSEVFQGDTGLKVVPGTKQVNGRAAVELTDSAGDALYVAAGSTAYVLRIAGTGSSAGTLNFTDFGDAPIPAVPTNAITLP